MRKIIINGFPHTGTTILRRIIGDHPDVWTGRLRLMM
jgi:hypothetical protein